MNSNPTDSYDEAAGKPGMFPHSLTLLTRVYLQGLIAGSALLSTAMICELPPPLFF